MGNLKVKYADLVNQKNNLDKSIENLKNVVTYFNNNNEDFKKYWDGPDADDYINDLKSIIGSIDNPVGITKTISDLEEVSRQIGQKKGDYFTAVCDSMAKF